MKSRRRLIVLAALVAVLAGIALAFRSSEPRYQGKRLSVWLDEFNQESPPEETRAQWEARRKQCTNVLQSLGTNALPYYLKWLQEKPPHAWYEKLDGWIGENTGYRIHLPRKPERVFEAEFCIEILGTAAEPAIPDLERLLTDKYCGSAAARCLVAIGPAALPVLSNAVAATGNYSALEALGSLGLASKPAAPLLFEIVLTNKSAPSIGFSLADLALRALAEGETNADALMPLLVERIADRNTAAGAAFGLARCGTAGIPVLLQAMTNEDVKIRSAAGAALDPRFQKYLGDERKGETGPRFRIFNSVFNMLMIVNSVSGPYSTNVEYQAMVRIVHVQRYTNDSNSVIRTQATNVLNYFNVLAERSVKSIDN